MHVVDVLVGKIISLKKLTVTQDESIKLKTYIQNLGFYRFMSYAIYFIDPKTKCFYYNIRLQDIINIYLFDKKLRLHLLDGLERVESSLKSFVSNELEISNQDPFYYSKIKNFPTVDLTNWDNFEKIIKKTIEDNISKEERETKKCFDKFFEENTGEMFPYVWEMFQELTFGKVTRFVEEILSHNNLSNGAAAEWFDLDNKLLYSWLRTLADLRNICAHHSRCWNRKFNSLPTKVKGSFYLDLNEYIDNVDTTITLNRNNKFIQFKNLVNNNELIKKIDDRLPLNNEDKVELENVFSNASFSTIDKKIPPFYFAKIPTKSRKMLYHQIAVLWFFLKRINSTTKWIQELDDLFKNHTINVEHMGFPKNWRTDKFWN